MADVRRLLGRLVLAALLIVALLAVARTGLVGAYRVTTETIGNRVLPDGFDIRIKAAAEAKRIAVAEPRADNVLFVRQRTEAGRMRVRAISHSLLQTLLWPIGFGLVLVGALATGSKLRRAWRLLATTAILFAFGVARTLARLRHEASTAECFERSRPPSALSRIGLDFFWTGETGTALVALFLTTLLCRRELSAILASCCEPPATRG